MPRIAWASLLFLATLPLAAQRNAGTLRLEVADPAGLALPASGILANQAAQFRLAFATDAAGRFTAQDLPFGLYHLELSASGFATRSQIVEIRSELPARLAVRLDIAPIPTRIDVSESPTLIEPGRTGSVYYVGGETLRDRPIAPPGRSVLDLVDAQPGWLLEANGVLHPRGSEYGAQYVIDGIPITDNRSPAFAPELDAGDLESLNVRTGGYPAEYGRKLGGVIEVVTQRDGRPGLHGKAVLSGGSFDTIAGFLQAQYGWQSAFLTLSAEGARTDRYLDPPVEPNFTNSGSNGGGTARFEINWSARDRLRLYVHRKQTRFLTPNEALQQAAGQRQDRDNLETLGQISYQRIVSPRVLANVRAMSRDFNADLWSNNLSTPILVGQSRGFRETYLNADVSVLHGRHDLKAGAEASFNSLHEVFNYSITSYAAPGLQFFDPQIPPSFRFSASHRNREQGLFAQDLIRAGSFTFSAGLRWDRYRLLVDESAFSPRLGVSWHLARLGLVFRAAYDRAFQTPPIENLLLSSSAEARGLIGGALSLPVRPSRGNFYEAGFSKSLFGRAAWTAGYFRRDVNHFLDDSVLLNTGLSFPIAFHDAAIYGFESKLDLPGLGRFSGFASYSYLVGAARFPATGGLFLEDNATALVNSRGRFPITQDQRHSARARLRYQLAPRLWTAWGASYGSGLPIEDPNLDASALAHIYGQRVLDRVNLERGRVRPSFTLDASLGVELWKKEHRSARLQAGVLNLTDRLNVTNFAGLFSGTALAPPRSVSLRFETAF